MYISHINIVMSTFLIAIISARNQEQRQASEHGRDQKPEKSSPLSPTELLFFFCPDLWTWLCFLYRTLQTITEASQIGGRPGSHVRYLLIRCTVTHTLKKRHVCQLTDFTPTVVGIKLDLSWSESQENSHINQQSIAFHAQIYSLSNRHPSALNFSGEKIKRLNSWTKICSKTYGFFQNQRFPQWLCCKRQTLRF